MLDAGRCNHENQGVLSIEKARRQRAGVGWAPTPLRDINYSRLRGAAWHIAHQDKAAL